MLEAGNEDKIFIVILFALLIVQLCPVEEQLLAITIYKSEGKVIYKKLPETKAF